MPKIKWSVMFSLLFVSQISSAQLICQNKNFLSQKVELSFDNGVWVYRSGHEICAFAVVKLENTKPQYKNWKMLKSQDVEEASCLVRTKLNAEPKRKLLNVYLSPEAQSFTNGFVRITIDNKSAEYGPEVVRSFLLCRTDS